MLDHPVFVLSRRIARPPDRVVSVLPLLPAAAVPGLRDVRAFERRPWGATRSVERTATALLHAERIVEAIELELGAWSDAATELRVRPAARHPERWSGRRALRYFTGAHATADAVVAWVEAMVPPAVRRDERRRLAEPLAS